MSPAPTAFWVDRDYDREHASDGISRYGAYLRDAAFEPWTDDDQAVEWAVFAWRRATGPVMSPGYVRYHPRVLAARLERSGWDGSLAAGVSLVSSWPEQLKARAGQGLRLATGTRTGRTGRPNVSAATPSATTSPAKRMSLPGRTCWPRVSLQFTVPSAALPEPPATSAALLSAGQQAVAVVVAELNRIVGPVLGAGLGPTSAAAGRAW